MRFARHLAAVLLLVGALVGTAIVAGHTPLASLVSDEHHGRRPPGDGVRDDERPERREAGPGGRDRRGDHGIGWSTTDDLIASGVTLVLLTGLVVVIDRRRPRRNRVPATR